MTQRIDWLSSLLGILTVQGQPEIRCTYGAPWQVAYGNADVGEVPYHIVLRGSAVLEDPSSGKSLNLDAGDIVMFPHGSGHVLHDGSGAPPVPSHLRKGLNLTFSENSGQGERLDMLCGRFLLSPPHDRFVRDYLPERLVVKTSAWDDSRRTETSTQLTGLLALMRSESNANSLGGYAMLNALSAALFTLTLRLSACSGWASTFGPSTYGNVQRSGIPMDSAGASRTL